MTRLSSWLVGTLLRRQTWPLEAFLAIQALCWGPWLLLPFRSFDVIPGAYTVLGLVPEPIWGVLFAGHGIAHLVVLWYRTDDIPQGATLDAGQR